MVFSLRYYIIFGFLIWGIIASFYASKIGPLTEPEEFIPKDHQINVIQNKLKDQFDGQGNDGLIVTLFWGVKGLDGAGGSQWDSSNIGKATLDDQADFSLEEV